MTYLTQPGFKNIHYRGRRKGRNEGTLNYLARTLKPSKRHVANAKKLRRAPNNNQSTRGTQLK